MPSKAENKRAFSELSFAAFRHLQTIYMSFLSPRSPVDSASSHGNLSAQAVLSAGKSVHGVRFAKQTRSASVREQSVFNLPGMHMLPKLFKAVSKLPDEVMAAHSGDIASSFSDLSSTSADPDERDKSLAATLNLARAQNFMSRYEPVLFIRELNFRI